MVITVDGDYGGGGREVARILAQMTGYINYDDDQMVLAAARERVQVEHVERLD